jgi:hypothetical protein
MRVRLEPSAPPPHDAYLRPQDRLVPDAEDVRPASGGKGRGVRARAGSPRGTSPGRKPRRTGGSASGRSKPKAAPAPEAPKSGGRTLAQLIKGAPKAVKRAKQRARKGSVPLTSSGRGTARKQPIAKGQRPGGGVRRPG